MSPKTKLKSDIITGIARKNLPRNNLPSEMDIISFFRYQHENQKLPTGQSIQIVATDTVAIWNQAGLPNQLKRNVVRRVAKLVRTWQRLRKAQKKKLSRPALKMCKMRLSYFFNISVNHIEEELRNDNVRAEFWSKQVINKIPVEFPESFKNIVPSIYKESNEKKTRKIDKKSSRQLSRTVREPTRQEKHCVEAKGMNY